MEARAFFRPKCLSINIIIGCATKPPACIIAPIHDISSTVNGPVSSGVSFDSSVCIAGDNQPIDKPIFNDAKFAV